MRATRLLGTSLFTTALALAACGDDEPTPPPVVTEGDIEVLGTWDTNFGFTEVITKTEWSGADIRAHVNAENYAIVQNRADAAFDPSKFSKYVWTQPANGTFYYCVVDYGLDTLEAAKATTKVADASNPEASGCGPFAWTRMFPPLEIKGTYTSSFGGMETITSTTWNGTPIARFSNAMNYAVTQNPSDSPFGANLFNKIVWTEPAAGAFYYCFVDFGRETLVQAETSTQTADATDPETSGCGMFSWTKLTR